MRRQTKTAKEDDGFKISQVWEVFTGIPRVLKLVITTNAPLTLSMAFISLMRGFIPVVSVSLTRLVIDSVVQAIRTHNIMPILLFVGIQLVVNVLDRLLSTVSNIVQQLLQERVSQRIQIMIMEKANTLDLAFFEDAEFYDKLRNAASEATYKPVSMISQLFDLVRTLVTLFSMLFLLFQLAWWLAIIALLVPIPSFIASSRYGWRGYQRMRRESTERRQLNYFMQVMTVDQYNKEIKLFNLGDFFIRQYHHIAEKLYDENKQLVIRRYLAGFLWSGLSIVANSGIYVYIALQAVFNPRRVTLGGLTMYTQTAVQVGQSFQSVLDGISSTYENNLFVSTLFEFLEYQPKILSPAEPVPMKVDAEGGLDIEFRHVSFTYPGKDPETAAALKDVSFTIRSGEAVALVGYNGAGKTTLVKLLTRLYDPDEGEILVGGRNIKEYDLQDLRNVIGVIFQDYVTYHLTARENIGVGRVDDIENQGLVESSAYKSGANVAIEKLAEGYDTMLGRWFKNGVQLSGGEWQKVALARAFMRNAPILILDEPTSALDAQAEYDIFARFRVLTKGKTAIFISHRFSTVRLADRILVLEHGQIIENGSHQELMALGGRYAELFNLQAEAYR